MRHATPSAALLGYEGMGDREIGLVEFPQVVMPCRVGCSVPIALLLRHKACREPREWETDWQDPKQNGAGELAVSSTE